MLLFTSYHRDSIPRQLSISNFASILDYILCVRPSCRPAIRFRSIQFNPVQTSIRHKSRQHLLLRVRSKAPKPMHFHSLQLSLRHQALSNDEKSPVAETLDEEGESDALTYTTVRYICCYVERVAPSWIWTLWRCVSMLFVCVLGNLRSIRCSLRPAIVIMQLVPLLLRECNSISTS